MSQIVPDMLYRDPEYSTTSYDQTPFDIDRLHEEDTQYLNRKFAQIPPDFLQQST